MLSYPQWKQVQRWTGALTVAAVAVLVFAGILAIDRMVRLAQGSGARERFENGHPKS